MSTSQVVTTIIDDRDPDILYLPDATDWTVRTGQGAQLQLYGNTDTFSDRAGASIQLTFTGDAIEYWGNQGPAHGPCAINLDGADQQTVNSFAAQDGVPIQLFKKDGLKSGLHTIKITVANPTPPNTCELDRFVVGNTTIIGNGPPNSTRTITSTMTQPSNSNTPSNTSSAGNSNSGPPWAIIGGAIGGGVLLVLIFLAFWFWLSSSKPTKRARYARDARSFRSTSPRTSRTSRTSLRRDTEKPALPPPTMASSAEKAGFSYGPGDGTTPGVHAHMQGQYGFVAPPAPSPHPHPPSQQSQFTQFGQPLPQHTHPMNSGLSVYSAPVTSPSHSPEPSQTSTYFSGHVRPLSQASGLEYYQQPQLPPQQYQQQYHQQQHHEQQHQQQQQQQYIYPAQHAPQPVWVSGEALTETGFAPVVASGPPASVQRTASHQTSASGRTAASPGFPQEKAVYSRNVQPESTPGSGGSSNPVANAMGEGSGSGAAPGPEAPPVSEAPPAYGS